jgi:L-aspartate oxidase
MTTRHYWLKTPGKPAFSKYFHSKFQSVYYRMHHLKADTAIVGSGLAGVYAAILAARHGSVALISRRLPFETSSYYAQGGIAAAIAIDDNPTVHAQDTIAAGIALHSKDAVRLLSEQAASAIADLENLGVDFDIKGKHKDMSLEGGHSRKRVLHIKGASTGKYLMQHLWALVEKNPDISVYQGYYATKIIMHENQCIGLMALKEEVPVFFQAPKTILATGGASSLFKFSTNPPAAVGDGVAMAYEAGAVIRDMEFVQFHPTVFQKKEGGSILLTEALRGDGAKLVNTENDVFLSDYDKRAELAPRDIVARAIYDQYFKQKQNVFLSFAGVRVTDAVRTKYQNLYNLIHSSGYDLFRDRIPVFPAAHYTIGGVQTDLNGATTIRGLYAVGEVASSGVHGANRLASNSLLECLVFARKAVADAGNRSNIGYLPDNIETGTPDHIIDAKIIHEIRLYMDNSSGIVREHHSLSKTYQRFLEMFNSLYGDTFVKLPLLTAIIIIRSAMQRTHSLGAHYRSDYPNLPESYEHSVYQKNNQPVYNNE